MFVAENQRIKEIIEANFNQLRQALQEQGIEVSQLSVSVSQEDAEERMNQFLKAQQENMRRLQRLAGMAEVEEEAEVMPVTDPTLENTVDYRA
jgi:flagellar hook-length control protein FliK